MSVREYALKFIQLSRQASLMVFNPRAKMSKFVSVLSETVVKKCCTVILIKKMDILSLNDFFSTN